MVEWDLQEGFGFDDIRYHKSSEGIAKITINRPEVRNSLSAAHRARRCARRSTTRATTRQIGVVILTGDGREGVLLPAATSASAARRATSAPTASLGSTCSTSSVEIRPCRSR